jgi:acyl-CoA reductase-like NAD-dependent aldehyde dehydrogenase
VESLQSANVEIRCFRRGNPTTRRSSRGLLWQGFQDKSRAQRLALEIEAGIGYLNHTVWTALHLPFGGIKRSGYDRELAEEGIQSFVNKKLVHSLV